MLVVTTWIWGDKYGEEYIARLWSGVQRGLKSTLFDFRVIHPQINDDDLLKGCLCRLRMFDPRWQHDHGIKPWDRIVCLDLDLVITGELDPLFDRSEDFVILQGANAANPCPYNGSVMMLRAGAHQEVWRDFSLDAVRRVPRYEFPDDQGWLWAKLPNAATWNVGSESGIYAFRKPQWPKDDRLPFDARIVAFPGARDPSQFKHLAWVQKHWV